MKKTTLLTFVTILLFAGVAHSLAAEDWIPLFNGKNLDGWEQTGQAEWFVKDGVLIGTQTTGKGGDLVSLKEWQDFELRFVYRVRWPANSGVWFRYDKEKKRGYQFDILKYANPVAYSGSLYCPGKLFITSNLTEALENREGWNLGTIRAQGQELALTLNGFPVGSCRDDTLDRGRLGVQVHGGDGFKGMQIAFKKIELRPLGSQADKPGAAYLKELDEAIALMLADEWGKGTQAGDAIEKIANRTDLNNAEKQALEVKLLEVLDNEKATHRVPHVALRTLNLVASDWCAVKLEKHLLDERLSHMVCNVLEKLSGHPATQTLIKALPRAEGRVKTGIITSLGVRQDPCALPVLLPLLKSGNAEHARAAVTALGHVGSVMAFPALKDMTTKGTATQRMAAWDACLTLAERLNAEDKKDEAMDVYRWLDSQDTPPHVSNAVLRGIVETDADQGIKQMLAALDGEDAQTSTLAGRIAGESNRPEITEALIKALPGLSVQGQVNALKALRSRGETSARVAVIKASKHSDERVRIAALETLGSVGTADDIDTFLRSVAQGSEPEIMTAARQVELMADPRVNHALLERLSSAEPALQTEIIALLGRRHYTKASSAMVPLASSRESETRVAALNYLSRFADEEQVPALVALLSESETDLKMIEKALVNIAGRSTQEDRLTAQLSAAVRGSSIPVHCTLIKTLGVVGGSKALDLVRTDLKADNETVRDAAFAALLAWPDTTAIGDLQRIAREGQSNRDKILALRSLIRVIGIDGSKAPDRTVSLYEQAWSLAARAEERRLVLSGLSTVNHVTALKSVARHLADADIKAEAEVAAVKLGVALLKAHPDEATKILLRVREQTTNQELIKGIRKALK